MLARLQAGHHGLASGQLLRCWGAVPNGCSSSADASHRQHLRTRVHRTFAFEIFICKQIGAKESHRCSGRAPQQHRPITMARLALLAALVAAFAIAASADVATTVKTGEMNQRERLMSSSPTDGTYLDRRAERDALVTLLRSSFSVVLESMPMRSEFQVCSRGATNLVLPMHALSFVQAIRPSCAHPRPWATTLTSLASCSTGTCNPSTCLAT